MTRSHGNRRWAASVGAAIWVSALLAASSAASAATGDVYVADFGPTGGAASDGKIVQIDPRTGAQRVVSSGGLLSDPSGVAVDKDGSLVVADNNGGQSQCIDGCGRLIRINPSTGAQSVISDGGEQNEFDDTPPYFVNPTGVAIAPDGSLLVSDAAAFFRSNTLHGAIIKVNPASGAQSILTRWGQLSHPFGIEVSPNTNSLVVADTDTQTDLAMV